MLKKLLPGNHSFTDFQNQVKRFESDPNVNSLLIFTAAGTKIDPNEYNPLLKATRLKIVGGIFPQIIFKGKVHDSGTILIACKNSLETMVLKDKSEFEDVHTILQSKNLMTNPNAAVSFVFVDALLSNKDLLFSALYNQYGSLPKYVGGGTGSLEFNSFASVYSNDGMIEGGAVIGCCNMNAFVGVAHGWEAITEPIKVTEAKDNQIISLNWRPAMEVYREIIEEHSGKEFDFDNFFDCTKSYPFGISKLGSENVVRDPFMQKDGTIFTLDKINEGSHVSILFGDKEKLIQGAETAKKIATPDESLKEQKELLLIDCISRVLFLNQDFTEELKKLDPNNIGFGALTLGEIANNGDTYLEVFNKSVVVCSIYG